MKGQIEDKRERKKRKKEENRHPFSVGQWPVVENCEFAFIGDAFFNIHNR
jgi:hypothetical protein